MLRGDILLVIIIIVNTGCVVYLWYMAWPQNPGLILPHSGTQAFIWGIEIYSQALDPTDCCSDILTHSNRGHVCFLAKAL